MSDASFVRYWGETYYSFRNGRYSYLFKPKYVEKTKWSIENHPVNQEWLKVWCDFWWDHKLFHQGRGGKYGEN